jgi:hypothetical protein
MKWISLVAWFDLHRIGQKPRPGDLFRFQNPSAPYSSAGSACASLTTCESFVVMA